VCSWEGSQIPNLTYGVRLLALVLLPTWLDLEGTALVKRHMLVQFQSSALTCRTDRWSVKGNLLSYLASVMDSTAVFETVRRGSTPWRGTVKRKSLECAGTHATLRRSKTRFESWQGH
jgi:hypothetical protein